MDYKEAANRLNISVGTVYNWVKSGKLHAIKTENGKWDISEEAVKDFQIKSGFRFYDDIAKPSLTAGIGPDGTSYKHAVIIDEIIYILRRNNLTINESNYILNKVGYCLGNTPL